MLASLLAWVGAADGQSPAAGNDSPPPALVPLRTIGSVAEDRARLRTLTGDSGVFSLIRSASSRTGWSHRPAIGVLAPELDLAVNTAIPWSVNDGATWAGRGVTVRAAGGAYARIGAVTAVLAPQVVVAQNRSFSFVHVYNPTRGYMLPPWRIGETSADLPVRFGPGSYGMLDPGQSSLWLDAGPVSLGASTENQQWGPGLRNAIVISDNAAGIPHLFIRTRTPLETRIGSVEARWMVGALTESPLFDGRPENDHRSYNAVAISLAPAFDPGLTLGVARAVYAPVSRGVGAFAHGADVFTRWSSETGTPFEQIAAVFGRWVFPDAGLGAHAEWARTTLPASFRDFLTSPNHTQGYTVGLEWAREVAAGGAHVRLQAEATMLEKSSTYRVRETPGFYVSARVPQGYTHRGQVIGAAIGPGASSQWLSADYLSGSGSIGAFATRVRWDQDAYYSRPTGDRYFAHDVSVVVGLRASRSAGWFELGAEAAHEMRYNYLFQNPSYTWGGGLAEDVRNWQLRLSLQPRARR